MLGALWKVRPPIESPRGGIWLGSGGPDGDGLWLGSLAEAVTGRQPQVWLSTAKEQVVAVVGKRGSGKSFTLGVIAEGLASGKDTALGKQLNPRAVLLFDPLEIYWTTRYPVAPSDNPEAQRHYNLAQAAKLTGLGFDVQAWIPGEATRRSVDPEWFRVLHLPVPAMGLDEWELLLDVNLMSEPMGQALVDALALIRDAGYHLHGEFVDRSSAFDLQSLVAAARSDELEVAYHPETLRALRQRLAALSATGLFSAEGSTLKELLSAGRVTVVLLGRLPQSYRAAVVGLLTRMLIDERSATAFAEKRLALDPQLDAAARARITDLAKGGIPRTVVVLDEAQSFLAPGPRSPARDLFVRLVKEGRNIGLSAVLATQQPSAMDQRVLSQVETFVAHQLVTEADIRAVRDNLKSATPEAVQFGTHQLDFPDLFRQLPSGVCVVSAADVNTSVHRAMVVRVRPRATVHGGIEL